VREADPTAEEQLFFRSLSQRLDDLQDWYHADDDGTLWMTVSYDFCRDGCVAATLRCDWDGARLLGVLNWDDGVRAEVAGVATMPPDGLEADAADPELAAAIAGAWFEAHLGRGAAEACRLSEPGR
jgi:hypothetical protein